MRLRSRREAENWINRRAAEAKEQGELIGAQAKNGVSRIVAIEGYHLHAKGLSCIRDRVGKEADELA